MSVATTNPFDLLFIDEPVEHVPVVIQIKEKTQPPKPKAAIKTKPLEASVVPERDEKDTRGSAARAASSKPSTARPRRENDRHQKTGRTDGDKKINAGKGTWAGSEVEQIDMTPMTPEEPKEPTEEEIAAQLEREIEEKQMSLADYLKSKKRVALPTPITEARAAGSDADKAQWNTAAAYEKAESVFVVLKAAAEPAVKQAKVSVRPVVIAINPPRFASANVDRGTGATRGPRRDDGETRGPRRENGEARGPRREDGEARPPRTEQRSDAPRGEPRGDRERGDKRPDTRAPKTEQKKTSAAPPKPRTAGKSVNINDTAAFPSLG